MSTCRIDGCSETATTYPLCPVHAEEADIGADLVIDASTGGYTDDIHAEVEAALERAFASIGTDEHGDVRCLPKSVLTLRATNAALLAIDNADRLLPDHTAIEQRWIVKAENEDGRDFVLTEPMSEPELRDWLRTHDLTTGQYVVSQRVIETRIPVDLPRATAAPSPALAGPFEW